MHEASIAHSILQIASSRAARYDNSNVDIIRIEVGSFRNVDPESLLFAFDSMKQDVKFCQKSSLEIKLVQATAVCQSLAHAYKPDASSAFRCPECNAGMGSLLTGEELSVMSCVLSALVETKGKKKEKAPEKALSKTKTKTKATQKKNTSNLTETGNRSLIGITSCI